MIDPEENTGDDLIGGDDLVGFEPEQDDLAENPNQSEQNPTEDEEPTEEESTAPDGEKAADLSMEVEFNGEKRTLAELFELAEKGASFAEKEEEFSQVQSYADTFNGLVRSLEESPEAANQAIQRLVELAEEAHGAGTLSAKPADFQLPEGVTEDMMDDLEKATVSELRTLRADQVRMRAEMSAMKAMLSEVQPVMGELVSTRKANLEVKQVETELGMSDVTAAQIAEAKAKYKESNAVTAMLKAERDLLRSKGAAETPKPPRTPVTDAQDTMDVSDPDAFFRQLTNNSNRG